MNDPNDAVLPVLSYLIADEHQRANVDRMLKLLGVDPQFQALRNLSPVLVLLMGIADRSRLFLGFADTRRRDAITDLAAAFAGAPANLAPRVVPEWGGNPLYGQFQRYPILAALLQPSDESNAALRHAQALLLGSALCIAERRPLPRMSQYATQVRLASDFKDLRHDRLIDLYRVPHRGLDAVVRMRRYANRLLHPETTHGARALPLVDSDETFVRALLGLTTLYTEQWALRRPRPTGLPEATFVAVGGEPALDDGLGGRLQLGYVRLDAGAPDNKSEEEDVDTEQEPSVVIQEEDPRDDKPSASPQGFVASARRAAGLHRYRARPVPWADGVLNPFERVRLVRRFEFMAGQPWSRNESGAALLAALVLALGRDLSEVLELDVGPVLGAAGARALRHRPPPVRPPRPDSDGVHPLPDPLGNELSLTLPSVVVRLLTGLAATQDKQRLGERLGGLGAKAWGSSITEVCAPALQPSPRRVTPGRLRDTMRAELLRWTRDPVCVFAITGSPRDISMTGALYGSFQVEALEEIHRQVVAEVFSTEPFAGLGPRCQG